MSQPANVLHAKGPLEIITRASGIHILVPSGVIYRDLGINPKATAEDVGGNEDCADLTGCWVGEENGIYDIAVLVGNRGNVSPDYLKFLYGHEEGHAISVLGQSERLFEEAKAKGIEYPVLTRKKAREYDRIAGKILGQPPSDQRCTDLCFIIHPLEREQVAEINGLLTILRYGVDQSIIDTVMEGMGRGCHIMNNSFQTYQD